MYRNEISNVSVFNQCVSKIAAVEETYYTKVVKSVQKQVANVVLKYNFVETPRILVKLCGNTTYVYYRRAFNP